VDTLGRSPTVPQGHLFVLSAKALIFIGQRRIEAMLVEEVEVGVREVSVDLKQNREFENESRKKTRHGT
jgi:hypothetical protein